VVCKGSIWKSDLARFEEHQLQEIQILLNVKAAVFWDVTPCILVEMLWHFRGTYGVAGCRDYYSKEISSELLEHFCLTAWHHIPMGNTMSTSELIPSIHCLHNEWYLFCLQILQNSGLQQQQQQQQHSRWVKIKDFITQTNPYTECPFYTLGMFCIRYKVNLHFFLCLSLPTEVRCTRQVEVPFHLLSL
jgi:hypothetical protein